MAEGEEAASSSGGGGGHGGSGSSDSISTYRMAIVVSRTANRQKKPQEGARARQI